MQTTQLTVALDSLDSYLSNINQFDILTRQEEYLLATRHKKHGDLEAAHKLVCANLRFVVKIANEYRAYGLKLADIIQEGNIGLMMAVRKFDPDRNIKLITYAVWWIRAYINNYIMRSWSMVKIGTTQAQKKLFFKLKQTRQKILQLSGQPAETSQLASELEVSDSDIEEMTNRMTGRDTSLNVELFEGEGFTLIDTIIDDRKNQEELLAEADVNTRQKKLIGAAMDALNEREQVIIKKRILTDPPSTLQDLADQYGISRERIRQLESNALKKLRTKLPKSEDCLSLSS